MLSTLLLLISTTFGGQLLEDNGFRGIRFGSDHVLKYPPMSNCVKSYEQGIFWVCKTFIGTNLVTVNYLGNRGIFSGVQIYAYSHEACIEIKEAFQVKYGFPTKEEEFVNEDSLFIKDAVWKDLPNLLWMKYNVTNGTCYFVSTNYDLVTEQRLREEAHQNKINEQKALQDRTNASEAAKDL